MSKSYLSVAAGACAALIMVGTSVVPAGARLAGGGLNAASKLQHIIIIMQENRSFDSYFGTYPGANGIPMRNGKPTICNPDPFSHKCIYSYHTHNQITDGGPHDVADTVADIDGGKMDGFIKQARTKGVRALEVMAYHDSRELSTYWGYAQNYVLQDAMFAPSTSWSLPEHLYLVSQWSAICKTLNVPSSCKSAIPNRVAPPGGYAWTDITWLLHGAGIPWKYYVFKGTSPDVINPGSDDGVHGIYTPQSASITSYFNPLPSFSDVIADNQLGNIVDGTTFYADAAAGTLPSVSWVIPDGNHSEHPPKQPSVGMAYVAGLVNAVMAGPQWGSTAIFVAWDEWGGLFDHVVPPTVDWAGYGMRVPGLVISPWAKHGYIDHQTLSFDAYNKLIEDVFLGGARLDPTTDGRPDPRPDVRENYPGLGNLLNDFNFSQTPVRRCCAR